MMRPVWLPPIIVIKSRDWSRRGRVTIRPRNWRITRISPWRRQHPRRRRSESWEKICESRHSRSGYESKKSKCQTESEPAAGLQIQHCQPGASVQRGAPSSTNASRVTFASESFAASWVKNSRACSRVHLGVDPFRQSSPRHFGEANQPTR